MSSAKALLPPQAADVAAPADQIFEITLFLAVFLAVVIVGLLLVFVAAFRARRPDSGPTDTGAPGLATQMAWIAGPVVGCAALFVLALPTWLATASPLSEAYRVVVDVRPWSAEELESRHADGSPGAGWGFTYPNGHTSRELHLPTSTKIRLALRGDENVHGLSLPALRLAGVAAPGRESSLWFTATETGTYPLVTTTYNGAMYDGMTADVVIESPDDFAKWLQKVSFDLSSLPPVDAGAIVYKRQGCAVCHSVDGSALVGPTFQGLWGKTETLEGGATVSVDLDYVRESLLEPGAKIVAGFDKAPMPTYTGRISDEEIEYLAAYLESLSAKEDR